MFLPEFAFRRHIASVVRNMEQQNIAPCVPKVTQPMRRRRLKLCPPSLFRHNLLEGGMAAISTAAGQHREVDLLRQ